MSRNQNLHGNISEKSELLWPSLNVGIKTTDLSQAYNDNRHTRIKKLVVTKLKVEEVHTLGHRTSINSQKEKKNRLYSTCQPIGGSNYQLYATLHDSRNDSTCHFSKVAMNEWNCPIYLHIHQHHLIQELLSRTIIPNTSNITNFSIWAGKKIRYMLGSFNNQGILGLINKFNSETFLQNKF